MDGLLQHVLDSLNQAVVAFDDELRLIAVNRKFIELLDLPEELGRIGTPFGSAGRPPAAARRSRSRGRRCRAAAASS